ncbi:hypothetical protein SAMN05660477_00638 [Soonwooa buanensis]|uniref:Uncharacterized protein n=1 Tax=Soonwooa buanensis TaxID=619805 RepID=A0A1T5D515_9FLAO|nr:hypothetical protein [Soonwooa buanensis]SKB66814.1 hypothetical protein SAMN05660477_00638 [Soonwooa buanensis]
MESLKSNSGLKDRQNIINLVLGLILLAIVATLLYLKNENRDFEKYNWSAIIYTSGLYDGTTKKAATSEKSDTTENNIELLKFHFYNTEEVSSSLLWDKNFYGDILNSKAQNQINSDAIFGLYPNHANISYFSYNDNAFYQLDQTLDYAKIKKIARKYRYNRESEISFFVDILSHNKVILFLGVNGDEDNGIELIDTLTSTKIKENWAILKQNAPSRKNIRNLESLQELVLSKKYWGVHLELPKDADLESISMTGFDNSEIKDIVSSDLVMPFKSRKLPKSILITWISNDKTYSLNYEIDGQSLLDAFKTLSLNTNEANINLSIIIPNNNKPASLFLKQAGNNIQIKTTNEAIPEKK